MNLSGGTEVGACFLSVCVAYPIKPVSLGFPALGVDVDVFDPEGRPIRGEVGELVCKGPWPGMTRGLWGDPERYLDTYWHRFPGVWTHGDWASVDADGYWYLHGRSDDTLNIAGKRIGPAELESAAVSHRPSPRRPQSACHTTSRARSRGSSASASPARGRRERRRREGRRGARESVRTGARRLRRLAAEDALGQDRPAGGARAGARQRPRRPLVLENPDSLEEIARAV